MEGNKLKSIVDKLNERHSEVQSLISPFKTTQRACKSLPPIIEEEEPHGKEEEMEVERSQKQEPRASRARWSSIIKFRKIDAIKICNILNEQNTNHAMIYLNNIPRGDLQEIFSKIFGQKILEIEEKIKEETQDSAKDQPSVSKSSLGGLFFKFCKIYIQSQNDNYKQRIKSIFKRVSKNRYKKRGQRRKAKRKQILDSLITEMKEIKI